MVTKNDGVPRSNKRQRTKGVYVRLSDIEHDTIKAKIDEINSKMHPDASKNAKYTIQRYLRDAAMRREFLGTKIIFGNEDDREALNQARKALASIGNLFLSWLKHGKSEWKGKGNNNEIDVQRELHYDLRSDTEQILEDFKHTHGDLRRILEKFK